MRLIRRNHILGAVGLLVSLAVSPAAAQRRVPDTNMSAIGASVGVSVPSDVGVANGLGFAANLDRYLTPRVSIRGQVGAAKWDIIDQRFSGTVRPIYVDGNVVYNWEGGQWHPQATGGVGLYHYRSTENGITGGDTSIGANIGGGIEYFYTRRSTITAEALYHWVDHFQAPLSTFTKGSFWTITGGLKHYF
jgi:hypothetical protein